MVERVVSYAQNREDRVIEAFLHGITKGFYVDVGANHPHDDSVTKRFYDADWNGINIEPNAKLMELLQRDRPRDINVQVGVADADGELQFREYKGHGLSTFSTEMAAEHSASVDEFTEEYVDYTVGVTTLAKLLTKHRPAGDIHFMKVDVEGFEYEVLVGNDWLKFRPWIICIEANHVKHDWHPLLAEKKYKLAFFDGLNEYFVSDEHTELIGKFDYVTYLITTTVINYRLEPEMLRASQLDIELTQKQTEIAELHKSLSESNQRLIDGYKLSEFLIHHVHKLDNRVIGDGKNLKPGAKIYAVTRQGIRKIRSRRG